MKASSRLRHFSTVSEEVKSTEFLLPERERSQPKNHGSYCKYTTELIKLQYITDQPVKFDISSLTSRERLGRIELTNNSQPGTSHRRRVLKVDGCAKC